MCFMLCQVDNASPALSADEEDGSIPANNVGVLGRHISRQRQHVQVRVQEMVQANQLL